MQLSSTLSWLVDVAGEAAGPDRLLAEVGARLVADGLPLAGGALTLAVPHPLIARRTWLWQADSGEVIEAFGFAAAGAASAHDDAGRRRTESVRLQDLPTIFGWVPSANWRLSYYRTPPRRRD